MLENFKDKSDNIMKIDDFMENIKDKYNEYYDQLEEFTEYGKDF